LKEAVFKQVTPPQKIGWLSAILNKKVVLLITVREDLMLCLPDRLWTKAVLMLENPGTFVPQGKRHDHLTPLDLKLCNRPGISVEKRDGISMFERVRKCDLSSLNAAFGLTNSLEGSF